MTFLEKGEATASIIAEGTCSVYIIEGYFINILFVDYPELAGRFYSYLATILAQRLSDREVAIQKEVITLQHASLLLIDSMLKRR